jgi:hypothetical protein
MGLPGREDIDALISVLNKLSPTRIPTTRELLLKNPDIVAFGAVSAVPIPGVGPVDLSSKFSAANAIPDDVVSGFAPMAGKVGKIAGSAFDAGMQRTPTAGMRFLKELAPTSAQGPFEDHFSTDRGMALDPKNLEGKFKRTDQDRRARYLSLRSTKESREMHNLRTDKEVDSFNESKRTAIIGKAKDALFEGRNNNLFELARDYIKYEGNVDTFESQLETNALNRHLTAHQRQLLTSFENAQRAKRLVR